jgi:murein L,D-transpeptidase YafK
MLVQPHRLVVMMWFAMWLSAAEPTCIDRSVHVVVDTESTTMALCKDGKPDKTYTVNIGAGGTGKTQQGDRKTPLGTYALSPPRASTKGFTWFVPVGYPTAAQKKQGFTGSAIGVHGPPDWMPQAIIDVAFFTPWTDGCIMVRTTAEIEEVRAWALEHRPKTIVIQ